ncbi:TetR/AcrR family transcriptional regulator [Paenibacillus sp. R14(2021)]|uniref:TetR/AcrR family transcriptional regulator n=1 Tax=Paenibacillus sp. R14(2021) TaxID=2859228 RepID=UPI001C6141DD|nr:TetR/AcrR family transcriptional regulator [Paenibacillus sp. R14(2021)]
MIPSTKEKILAASLELIKSEGIEHVTIRKIAALAGTNVALINYYFGSKERLISETLKIQLQSFQEAFSVFDEMDLPPLVRLKNFLMNYTSSIQAHPELIKRVLGQEQLFESQTEYVEFLKSQGIEKLSAAITEMIGPAERERVLLMIQQIFAAILSPIIKASFAEKNGAHKDKQFHVTASVEEQIDLFLELYFHKFTAR